MRGYWLLVGCFVTALLFGCSGEEGKPRQLLGTASDCDAAVESCQIAGAGISVTLALGPDVKPLATFPMQLMIKAGEVVPQGVVVDFQMQGMDMGINRYRLQPSPTAGWAGTATLPICTASRMDWLAVVEFSLGEQSYQAVFPFHTETN
jgi:hypothetical protein